MTFSGELKWAKQILSGAKKAKQAAEAAKAAAAKAAREAAAKAAKAKAAADAKIKQLAAEAKAKARADAAKKKAETSGAGDSAKADEPLSCKTGNSFVPGTLVLLADGTRKPIEELEPGDEVLAGDEETGRRSGGQLVTAHITGGGEKALVTVTIRDGDGDKQKIVATDEHPFWNPEKRTWVDAVDLRSGEWLKSSAGTWVQVVDVDVEHKRAVVHNVTVDRDQTYYVLAGTTPVLVHNCGKDQGIYEFPDQHNPGETYVGKSINLTNRLGDHLGSGRLASMDDVKITHVCGCEDDVYVAEHLRIQQLRKLGISLSNIKESPGRSILDRRNQPMLPGAEEWGQ
jgi:hypothetical protein